MCLSTHGLKLLLVFFTTSEGSGSVCLHFFLSLVPWISSIGEVELRLDLVESSRFCCLSSILRSFGFMEQELDEPRKLACLDTTTL
jgi:hypothetical protein